MKARGLVWLGTRTRNFDDTVRFFGDTLCLRAVHEEPDFAVFRLPNGDKVEVFGPGDEEHEHFDKGPVAGFLVDDVREACADLEAAGIAFIGVPFTRPTTADHAPTSEDPTATSTRSPRQRNQARRKES